VLAPHAEGQLFARLNIAGSYIHRCPDFLQAINVNYWIGEKKDKQILARYIDNRIRAIFSTRHCGKAMDDHEVFPIVLEELEKQTKDFNLEDLHLKDFLKYEDFTVLRAYFKHLVSEKDEKTYWVGVTIVNSEVGKSSLWIKPCIRGGNYTQVSDFFDRSHEGSTSLKHVGEMNKEKIRKAIQLAKETAEVGIARLMEMSSFIVDNPGKDAASFIEKADFLPNRLVSILEEKYQSVQEASKLAIAQSILASVRDMPTFQRYLAEAEVGRYLDLFSNTKQRAQQIIEANEHEGN